MLVGVTSHCQHLLCTRADLNTAVTLAMEGIAELPEASENYAGNNLASALTT